jgi:hypothetical protein
MSIRRVLGSSAVALLAPAMLVAGTVQAADASTTTTASSITVQSSDLTPASGQTFYVSGVFVDQGVAADHEPVKVQRLFQGTWSTLTGAVVRTTSDGRYQLRVILQTTGVRELRVVGVTAGSAHDTFKRFTETVH